MSCSYFFIFLATALLVCKQPDGLVCIHSWLTVTGRLCSPLEAVNHAILSLGRALLPFPWNMAFCRRAARWLNLVLQTCCTEIACVQPSWCWMWLSRPWDWTWPPPTPPPPSLPPPRVWLRLVTMVTARSCYLLMGEWGELVTSKLGLLTAADGVRLSVYVCVCVCVWGGGGGASQKDQTVPCTSIHCSSSQWGKQDQ